MIAYLTRVLKAPTIGACWEDLAAQARDENWSHEEYLAALLQRQVADRESKGTVMRIRAAHFPQVKTLEDFNLDHLPSMASGRPRAPGDRDVRLEGGERGPARPARDRQPTSPSAWESRRPTPDTRSSSPPRATGSPAWPPPTRPAASRPS
ncbi:ATP-binding protein [Streptomyces sp. NPDC007355]|uniref:ATP-binding protein n=1 Tax=Streptomyces sp. NPDC007355 TaxID=3364778 RepID=UPI003678670E